jgi:phosphoglycolate phosphatase
MKNDAIIFDIDGTLWNATMASEIGLNNGLQELGSDNRVTKKDIESVTGKPYVDFVKELVPEDYEKHSGKLVEFLDKFETKAVKEHGGDFYPGVIDGIRKLARKYRIFLLSNCQTWYLKVFLEALDLNDVIEGYDCNGMSNLPKSDMMRNMREKYSLQNPVYIGDTNGDFQATQIANMQFVYVTYGMGHVDGECEKFDTFDEVVNRFYL